MKQTSHQFNENVTRALSEPTLKVALDRTTTLLRSRRAKVIDAFPQYAKAREAAQKIKDHTLDHLGHYLREFENNAVANGAKVYWAATPEDARKIVSEICVAEKAQTATRVKSMLGEEIGIAEALTDAGVERIETDLAEHIIQLAGDPPSHIVMPAMHKTQEQVAELFAEKHKDPSADQDVTSLVGSARRELRSKFINADISISGANFLIADTGSFVTITNEGNAELTTTPPKTHIVTVGIEKMVPSLKHAAVFIRLLSRAAIGTEITQYTTFYNGPKRDGDRDGPENLHIVLVDNHRSDMLSDFLRPMLRCIRCGACMNHCPVYSAVGGHAYGAVYPGPMGSVLTPAMTGLKGSKDLPNACTLNGRCKEVCPVNIPLPDMLRSLRARQFDEGMATPMAKWSLKLWAFMATRPTLYRLGTSGANVFLRMLARGRGKIRAVPLAGGWTATRDLPQPEAGTFMQQYQYSKGDK
ncbi:MAG: LutB/LldF family L-lactate oxidation iron-sulfur protein [Roseobacter sp.]